MKQVVTYLILSLFAWACIPEDLPIENIPQASPRLVVSSAIRPEIGMAVTVTRSVSALDGATQLEPEQLISAIAVSGANVRMVKNDDFITFQELFPGVYGTQETDLENNVEYELLVTNPNNNVTTKAKSTYKKPVSLIHVDAKAVKATSDSLAEVTVVFFDDGSEKNWYMATTQPFSEPDDDGPLLSDEDVFTHIFTDEGKNGERIIESFIALDFDGYEVGDSVIVAFSSISKDYYDFLDARENDLTGVEFLYEPYNYPTNVENGYGFFSLHVIEQHIIRVLP